MQGCLKREVAKFNGKIYRDLQEITNAGVTKGDLYGNIFGSMSYLCFIVDSGLQTGKAFYTEVRIFFK